MTKPTLHLLGLPHTVTRPEYSHCAFTGKIQRFSPMMRSVGYEVIHYGNAGAVSGANEQVDVLPASVVKRTPPGENIGLSFAANAAAHMLLVGPRASAVHPSSDGFWAIKRGDAPGCGRNATIVVPVPCTLERSLKLQTTRSPGSSLPEFAFAISSP